MNRNKATKTKKRLERTTQSPLMGHDRNLGGGRRGRGTGGDDLSLGQWTGNRDSMRDPGSTVGWRRWRRDASSIRGPALGLVLLEIVGLHGDLATRSVVNGVDRSMVADSE